MKIQDRFFCFAVVLLLVVFTVCYMFFVTPLDNKGGRIFWGFFVLIGSGFFSYHTCNTILWTSRARRFKYHFGINPPNFPDGDWKQMAAIQPIVDECLKIEAIYLQAAYDAENSILQKKPENIDQARDRAEKIMTQAALVDVVKKFFWRIHNLAREWGFEVWDSHSDYVSAIDRAGKEKIKKKF